MNTSFLWGFKKSLPIAAGVLPFGIVMGTAAASGGISLFDLIGMSFSIFAGASQLAALELMISDASILVVILSGIMINLRFVLYSIYFSKHFRPHSTPAKLALSHFVIDQTYAVSQLHYEQKNLSPADRVYFFIGSAVTMFTVWQSSVLGSFIFSAYVLGAQDLDFMVPLCFIGLIGPNLTNKQFAMVTIASVIVSSVLVNLPHNLNLIVTAFACLGLGSILGTKETENEF